MCILNEFPIKFLSLELFKPNIQGSALILMACPNNKGGGVFYLVCLLEILTESSVAISQSSSTSSQAWWDKPCDLALSEPGQ